MSQVIPTTVVWCKIPFIRGGDWFLLSRSISIARYWISLTWIKTERPFLLVLKTITIYHCKYSESIFSWSLFIYAAVKHVTDGTITKLRIKKRRSLVHVTWIIPEIVQFWLKDLASTSFFEYIKNMIIKFSFQSNLTPSSFSQVLFSISYTSILTVTFSMLLIY